MQTLDQVTRETRMCVMLVIMISMMWMSILPWTYFHPLEQHSVNFRIVNDAMLLCVQICTGLSVLVFVIGN